MNDYSGVITTPDTSQAVIPANANRRYLLFQNVSDTDMWINFGNPAVQSFGSVLLRTPGGSYAAEGDHVPKEVITVICAAAGRGFTAKEN